MNKKQSIQIQPALKTVTGIRLQIEGPARGQNVAVSVLKQYTIMKWYTVWVQASFELNYITRRLSGCKIPSSQQTELYRLHATIYI